MARPDPSDHTRHELANRCYEFIDLVSRNGQAFQKWNAELSVEGLTGLRGEEIDSRVERLKDAFSAIAGEKTGWQVDEALSTPLHPRHEMKERGVLTIEIRLVAKGEQEHFLVTVPRNDYRGNPQHPPLKFVVDQ